MGTLINKTDAQIQDDVVRELRWDTRVNATDIGVEVSSGVVTLTGTVDSWARRTAAAEAAHRVAGVLDVANDVRVRPIGSLERTDADVARAVRHALEWDARVPDRQIRSTVTAGAVALEGTVETWSQREDAEAAVRNLAGVTSVSNALIVQPQQVSEAELRRAIRQALERHAAREAQHVEMRIYDGRVTLEGTVHSWSERRAIVGAAGATPGVRSVHDLLQIDF